MSKIGVFICHCGENISATVDCEKVAEAAKEMEGVAYAIDYKYMCSDPGQTLIKNATPLKNMDWMALSLLPVLRECMNLPFGEHVRKPD